MEESANEVVTPEIVDKIHRMLLDVKSIKNLEEVVLVVFKEKICSFRYKKTLRENPATEVATSGIFHKIKR